MPKPCLLVLMLLSLTQVAFSETDSPDPPVSIKIHAIRDNLLQYSSFTLGDILLFNNPLMSSFTVGVAYRPEGQGFFWEGEIGMSKTSNRLNGWAEPDQIDPTGSVNVGFGDRLHATAIAVDLRYFPSKHFVSNVVPMVELYHRGFGLSFLYLPTWLFTNPTIAEQYFLGLSYSLPADFGDHRKEVR